jgi:hypothetical protein
MPIVGAVYAMLVEVDDGAEEGSTADPALMKKTGIRVENIDVGEEEGVEVSASEAQSKSSAKK